MNPGSRNLVVRPGKLLCFPGGCSVLTCMQPIAGPYYSRQEVPLLVLVLATGMRRTSTDTQVFALCLLQGLGMCWISHNALNFLPETV